MDGWKGGCQFRLVTDAAGARTRKVVVLIELAAISTERLNVYSLRRRGQLQLAYRKRFCSNAVTSIGFQKGGIPSFPFRPPFLPWSKHVLCGILQSHAAQTNALGSLQCRSINQSGDIICTASPTKYGRRRLTM